MFKGTLQSVGAGLLRERRRRFLLRTLPRNAMCAEIGVWKGDFSEKILRNTQPKRLHLIDPWRFEKGADAWWGGGVAHDQNMMDEICQSVCRRFRDVPTVEIHRAESSACENLFPDRYFDWVYIDGDHEYESVRSDLEVFFKKVKGGGYLAGDDFFWGARLGYPVMRAVTDVARYVPLKFVYASRDQYILRKAI